MIEILVMPDIASQENYPLYCVKITDKLKRITTSYIGRSATHRWTVKLTLK